MILCSHINIFLWSINLSDFEYGSPCKSRCIKTMYMDHNIRPLHIEDSIDEIGPLKIHRVVFSFIGNIATLSAERKVVNYDDMLSFGDKTFRDQSSQSCSSSCNKIFHWSLISWIKTVQYTVVSYISMLLYSYQSTSCFVHTHDGIISFTSLKQSDQVFIHFLIRYSTRSHQDHIAAMPLKSL